MWKKTKHPVFPEPIFFLRASGDISSHTWTSGAELFLWLRSKLRNSEEILTIQSKHKRDDEIARNRELRISFWFIFSCDYCYWINRDVLVFLVMSIVGCVAGPKICQNSKIFKGLTEIFCFCPFGCNCCRRVTSERRYCA